MRPNGIGALGVEPFEDEQLPQRIVFGWGRFAELPDEVERLGAERVLLVAERSTMVHAEEAARSLGGRFVRTIGPARPHVPAEDAGRARSIARAEDADLVVSIGGGSATGLAKWMAADGVPLLAIPTTYAGSEMTPIYGTTEGGRKTTGRDVRVLPRAVLYDAALTVTLPPRVTATTGMNAIAHSVEALYAEHPTPVSTLLAEESIRVMSAALPECVRAPADVAARSSALYGAYLAGSVLATTGMAIHHRICHVLGGLFGVAHGDANAVVLPHSAAFNEPAAPAALERVARALDARRAAPALYDLARSLGSPASLDELGIEHRDLGTAAELVMDGAFYNPRPVTVSDVAAILEAAYLGRRPAEAA
jgi:alcohol dehydrogenase class IV